MLELEFGLALGLPSEDQHGPVASLNELAVLSNEGRAEVHVVANFYKCL